MEETGRNLTDDVMFAMAARLSQHQGESQAALRMHFCQQQQQHEQEESSGARSPRDSKMNDPAGLRPTAVDKHGAKILHRNNGFLWNCEERKRQRDEEKQEDAANNRLAGTP